MKNADGQSSQAIIRVRDLVKEFRRPERIDGKLGGLRTFFTQRQVVTRAVDGISFDIAEGDLVGYLGPNGAGKSTTIKMLTGVLAPTSGSIKVAGLEPWRDRRQNAKQIGVVFGQRSQLWWDLPLSDSLRLIGKMYDLDHGIYQRNLDQFTELLDMRSFMDTPVRQLSLGQRMRGDLAAAMLYNPRILYLDEPTVGLDVVAKERMRSFIADLNQESKTTVILTTHDLADVERLCKRIILIDRGMVLHDGDIGSLKSRYAPYRELVVQLVTAPPQQSQDRSESMHGRLEMEGVIGCQSDPGQLRVQFDPRLVQVAQVIARVVALYPVSDISIIEPELEGVVRHIYDGNQAALGSDIEMRSIREAS
ncbi:ABC transporter ATP-binding protein [Nonomuraea glycinis]|uniref:ABC transporter ATP-binding protein n=1 Tax=Nonomuraea glycinis TaxID=2047744 RepID=UPI0033BB464A